MPSKTPEFAVLLFCHSDCVSHWFSHFALLGHKIVIAGQGVLPLKAGGREKVQVFATAEGLEKYWFHASSLTSDDLPTVAGVPWFVSALSHLCLPVTWLFPVCFSVSKFPSL